MDSGEILYKLSDELSSMGNTFQVLVNHLAIRNSDGKFIFARYFRDPAQNIKELQFGVYSKINSKQRFVKSEDCKQIVMSYLLDLRVLGRDLSFDTNDLEISVNFNLDFNVMDIVQNTYETIFSRIYLNNDLSEIRTLKGYTLSREEVYNLFVDMDAMYMRNYLILVNKKFFRRLSTYSSKNFTLKFYKTFDTFVPVIFKVNCLINPFIDCKRHFDYFKNTELYSNCLRHSFKNDRFYVCYATQKVICESLNIPSTIGLQSLFTTTIMFGLLNKAFPNKESIIYVNKEDGSMLPENSYRELPDILKSNYIKMNTLRNYCRAFYRKYGFSKSEDLYQLVYQVKFNIGGANS